VNFHQWDKFAMFFKRLNKVGDGEKEAELVHMAK
jgi:branched-chain amino acid transport system substrate-binding protein